MDDKKEQDKVAAFDTLFTTNHLQMLKVLVTYLEPSIQKSIAVYIKWMELQYTLSFFRLYPGASLEAPPHAEAKNPEKLCEEMLPYCSPSEKERLLNMKGMLQNFSNMQEMLSMLQTMKELFPEGEAPFSGDMSDILSGLSGMGRSDSNSFDLTQIMNLFQNK